MRFASCSRPLPISTVELQHEVYVQLGGVVNCSRPLPISTVELKHKVHVQLGEIRQLLEADADLDGGAETSSSRAAR